MMNLLYSLLMIAGMAMVNAANNNVCQQLRTISNENNLRVNITQNTEINLSILLSIRNNTQASGMITYDNDIDQLSETLSKGGLINFNIKINNPNKDLRVMEININEEKLKCNITVLPSDKTIELKYNYKIPQFSEQRKDNNTCGIMKDPTKVPWIVYIKNSKSRYFSCTGVIFRKNAIVAVRKCIEGLGQIPDLIVLLPHSGKKINITNIVFDEFGYANIEVSNLTFNNRTINKICLSNNNQHPKKLSVHTENGIFSGLNHKRNVTDDSIIVEGGDSALCNGILVKHISGKQMTHWGLVGISMRWDNLRKECHFLEILAKYDLE